MEFTKSWVLSADAEKRLLGILPKFAEHNASDVSKIFMELLHYGSLPIPNQKIEMDVSDADTREAEIFDLFKESFETNSTFPENRLIGLSQNALNRILGSIRDNLRESDFPGLCKFLAGSSNNALVEEFFRLVVYPKIREKKEASASVIFSLKELTLVKAENICHNLIIPLLVYETSEFTDSELLCELFSTLQPSQQDSVIVYVNLVCLTSKATFQETDWLLLQPLVKDLSQNGINNAVSCICKFSSDFTRSQIFGRFLVHFCKNVNHINNKELLIEAIEKHQTLLKKQALKFLESF